MIAGLAGFEPASVLPQLIDLMDVIFEDPFHGSNSALLWSYCSPIVVP